MRQLVLLQLIFLEMVLAAGAGCAAAGSVLETGFPAAIGRSFRDQPYTPELVVIPTGTFTMGASAKEAARERRNAESAAWERPEHVVVVAAPLAVGRFLVTVGEYRHFVTATGRLHADGCTVLDRGEWQLQAQRSYANPAFAQTERHPVTCVTVADAEAYARWLTDETGFQYRLLHESEWEFAARAGTVTARWLGDERHSLCRHANGADLSYDRMRPGDPSVNRSCDDHFAYTNPVDSFPANPFGLHDMLGNLWQWTADCFVSDYRTAPAVASKPIEGGDCARRVIRGGSWHNSPDALRSAARYSLPVTMRSASIGFRIVRLAERD